MMKNRREFIKTVAAAAATAMVPAGVMAQGTRGRAGRIDVHHHMIPRFQSERRQSVGPGRQKV